MYAYSASTTWAAIFARSRPPPRGPLRSSTPRCGGGRAIERSPRRLEEPHLPLQVVGRRAAPRRPAAPRMPRRSRCRNHRGAYRSPRTPHPRPAAGDAPRAGRRHNGRGGRPGSRRPRRPSVQTESSPATPWRPRTCACRRPRGRHGCALACERCTRSRIVARSVGPAGHDAWRSAWTGSGRPTRAIARLLLERGLAAIYLIAFLNAFLQFPALLGERGLMPAPRFLAAVGVPPGAQPLPRGATRTGCCARWRPAGWSSPAACSLGLAGVAGRCRSRCSRGSCSGCSTCRSSTSARTFYAFGWESLLLEAGFLAIFLGNDEVAPPVLVILLFRWLAFRLEFGAGLIKLRGDACWRDLTCLDYHHETQPMPNPLSWFFHHLPRPAAPGRGRRQPRRAARRAVRACSCRSRSRRVAALVMIVTPALAGGQRQLRLAELDHDRDRAAPVCPTRSLARRARPVGAPAYAGRARSGSRRR